jgi:predicted N-acyltransferase
LCCRNIVLLQVPQAEWDALVEAQAEVNPFLRWAFLHALEASKSVVRGRGVEGARARAWWQAGVTATRVVAALSPRRARAIRPLQAPEQGWAPQHVVARDDATSELLGVVPLYLKGHSYGEYIFDSSWAQYSHMMGKG